MEQHIKLLKYIAPFHHAFFNLCLQIKIHSDTTEQMAVLQLSFFLSQILLANKNEKTWITTVMTELKCYSSNRLHHPCCKNFGLLHCLEKFGAGFFFHIHSLSRILNLSKYRRIPKGMFLLIYVQRTKAFLRLKINCCII